MRLQVLPLPEQRVGDHSVTPYILIFSELTETQQSIIRLNRRDLIKSTGAQDIIGTEWEVEL